MSEEDHIKAVIRKGRIYVEVPEMIAYLYRAAERFENYGGEQNKDRAGAIRAVASDFDRTMSSTPTNMRWSFSL